jgi:hypothetical protein
VVAAAAFVRALSFRGERGGGATKVEEREREREREARALCWVQVVLRMWCGDWSFEQVAGVTGSRALKNDRRRRSFPLRAPDDGGLCFATQRSLARSLMIDRVIIGH